MKLQSTNHRIGISTLVALALAYGYHTIKILENGLLVLSVATLCFGVLYNVKRLFQLRNSNFAATLIFSFVFSCSLATLYVSFAFDPLSDVEKIHWFFIALLAFGLFPSFTILEPDVTQSLPTVFVWWSFAMFVAFLLNMQQFSELGDRAVYGDSNPIALGRVFCLGSLSSLYLLVTKRYSIALLSAIFATSMIGMLLTGSRGPLVAAIASCSYILGMTVDGRMAIRLLLAGLVIVFGMVAFLVFDIDLSLRVLDSKIEDDGRNGLFSYAIELILRAPSGIGVGSFDFESHTYPHNIFLELALEWGWIVGGIIIILILSGVVRIFFLGRQLIFIQALAITDLINSSLSGDVTSPRLLYSIALAGHLSLFMLFFAKNKTIRRNDVYEQYFKRR